MPESADSVYANFLINKRQTMSLAFLVLSYDIDSYIAEHLEEYETFLKAEGLKERGEIKDEKEDNG